MTKAKFSPYDAADYLKTERDIAAYLVAAAEDGDPKVLIAAMGDAVRARNVSHIAREAGMTREGVYKAFSPAGNPSFATVLKVARALDVDVSFQAKKAKPKLKSKGSAKAPSGGRASSAARGGGRTAK